MSRVVASGAQLLWLPAVAAAAGIAVAVVVVVAVGAASGASDRPLKQQ